LSGGRINNLTKTRAFAALRSGVLKGARTFLWLAAIMIPVSLVVTVLQHLGVVDRLAVLMEGPFRAMGLPGSSALVVVTSVLLNLYSAIGVMVGLGMSLRAMTILAVVCLIAHNYLVELVVTRRTGTPILRMFVVRTVAAFLAGFMLNLLLPESLGALGDTSAVGAVGAGSAGELGPALSIWLRQSARLMGKVFVVVMLLMTFVSFLQSFGLTELLARHLSHLMRLFGLPREVAFLWLVSNTLGLAYGAGVLVEEVKGGRLSKDDGDLLNHHLSLSHSLLEDTLLFVALGVPAIAIVAPRLLLALLAVWERRGERALLRPREKMSVIDR
jgi:spore maturation protein SpmB